MTWEETARSEAIRLRNLAAVTSVASGLAIWVDNDWLLLFSIFAASYSYVASLLEWKRKELAE